MNRSKAPLLLMEQLVMLLVFALAAALCLQAFVLADARSMTNESRDRALLVTQSAAERWKAYDGDVKRALPDGQDENGDWLLCYDADWNAVDEGGQYRLLLSPLTKDKDNPLLGRAELRLVDTEGEELIYLPLACQWQTEVHEDA